MYLCFYICRRNVWFVWNVMRSCHRQHLIIYKYFFSPCMLMLLCAELSVIFESRKLSKVYVQSHYNWHSLCMNVLKLCASRHSTKYLSHPHLIIRTFSSSSLLVCCCCFFSLLLLYSMTLLFALLVNCVRLLFLLATLKLVSLLFEKFLSHIDDSNKHVNSTSTVTKVFG